MCDQYDVARHPTFEKYARAYLAADPTEVPPVDDLSI